MLLSPIGEEKFERLCQLLRLKQGARVLDIACGKGEFLVRLAEVYGISGVGVDISPRLIKKCLEKKVRRVPDSDIQFMEMDGSRYVPESYESFDLAMCIGASFVYGGYRGTIHALKKMTKPEGLMAIGEPYWLKEPCEEYLRAEGYRREQFETHYGNVKMGEEEGLTCIYTLVSSQDDWDNYAWLGWWDVYDYAWDNPDIPDVPKLLESVKWKESYLRWGRDTLGWAIYLFRKP